MENNDDLIMKQIQQEITANGSTSGTPLNLLRQKKFNNSTQLLQHPQHSQHPQHNQSSYNPV